jgi:hypothetical protein
MAMLRWPGLSKNRRKLIARLSSRTGRAEDYPHKGDQAQTEYPYAPT